MIESWTIKWAGYGACMGEKRNACTVIECRFFFIFNAGCITLNIPSSILAVQDVTHCLVLSV
jgi:hypothetical protein